MIVTTCALDVRTEPQRQPAAARFITHAALTVDEQPPHVVMVHALLQDEHRPVVVPVLLSVLDGWRRVDVAGALAIVAARRADAVEDVARTIEHALDRHRHHIRSECVSCRQQHKLDGADRAAGRRPHVPRAPKCHVRVDEYRRLARHALHVEAVDHAAELEQLFRVHLIARRVQMPRVADASARGRRHRRGFKQQLLAARLDGHHDEVLARQQRSPLCRNCQRRLRYRALVTADDQVDPVHIILQDDVGRVTVPRADRHLALVANARVHAVHESLVRRHVDDDAGARARTHVVCAVLVCRSPAHRCRIRVDHATALCNAAEPLERHACLAHAQGARFDFSISHEARVGARVTERLDDDGAARHDARRRKREHNEATRIVTLPAADGRVALPAVGAGHKRRSRGAQLGA